MSDPNEINDDEDMIFDDDDVIIDDDEEASYLPVAVEIDDVQLPAAWVTSSRQADAVRSSRKMFNLKHGYLANVPMVCRDKNCPLNGVCTIPQGYRPKGERCPIEIAAVIDGFDKFCKELNVQDDDYFDQSQVKDLVDIEVKLMRTRGVLASAEHFIELVVIGTDSSGNKLETPQLHKATEYEDKLLARKAKILSDLNSTRKQREKNQKSNDPSSFATELIQKAMRAKMRIQVIDVDSDEQEDDDVDVISDNVIGIPPIETIEEG